ncbi:MAG: helix-turn-helix domain-containing protein [Clostridia bacterium]|nr:helix-turn-helix domain-containing protein [Clostridia bacterium]
MVTQETGKKHYHKKPVMKTPPEPISLYAVIKELSDEEREKLYTDYGVEEMAEIFSNEETMKTVDCFLENGMNVCLAARKLYMHRNTLNYRLNKIRRVCGLDLRIFDMAVTFRIMRVLYETKTR